MDTTARPAVTADGRQRPVTPAFERLVCEVTLPSYSGLQKAQPRTARCEPHEETRGCRTWQRMANLGCHIASRAACIGCDAQMVGRAADCSVRPWCISRRQQAGHGVGEVMAFVTMEARVQGCSTSGSGRKSRGRAKIAAAAGGLALTLIEEAPFAPPRSSYTSWTRPESEHIVQA